MTNLRKTWIEALVAALLAATSVTVKALCEELKRVMTKNT